MKSQNESYIVMFYHPGVSLSLDENLHAKEGEKEKMGFSYFHRL